MLRAMATQLSGSQFAQSSMLKELSTIKPLNTIDLEFDGKNKNYLA